MGWLLAAVALVFLSLEHALDAGVPCGWVTGDEVYGGDNRLRRWLEERDVPHVLAVKRSESLWSLRLRQERAFQLAAQLPAGAWRRLSVGDGAKGPRSYAWARVAIRPLREPGRALAAGAPQPGRWGAGVLPLLRARPHHPS